VAILLATISDVPPVANGTTKRIGFSGKAALANCPLIIKKIQDKRNFISGLIVGKKHYFICFYLKLHTFLEFKG
jgi:hypothetical protein